MGGFVECIFLLPFFLSSISSPSSVVVISMIFCSIFEELPKSIFIVGEGLSVLDGDCSCGAPKTHLCFDGVMEGEGSVEGEEGRSPRYVKFSISQ